MSSQQISLLQKEISDLRSLLKEKELELRKLLDIVKDEKSNVYAKAQEALSKEDIQRFSRQIILSEVGSKGQVTLRDSSVLIVGVGGLGCPAAQYLCGAGIGHIALIDYDEVEISNLHRQLLHSEQSIGFPKTTSAACSLKRLNSSQKITEYKEQLNSLNALEIIKNYDLIIDASDNVATRYLLNDACVLTCRPLVSGSALRLEGQLTVYSFKGGPCYRCVFPKPPPPETITNCGDGGVLGVVPGVIGVLEALEAIKILLNWSGVLSGQLLLFNAEQTSFHKVRLRNKNLNCDVCGDNPTIRHLIDYEQFCGAKATDKDTGLKILDPSNRITAVELSYAISSNSSKEILLLDVRDPNEFEMCNIKQFSNFPMKSLDDEESCNSLISKINGLISQNVGQVLKLCVICRRGNDSQVAVKKLMNLLNGKNIKICDVEGGLHSWSKMVDNNFPLY